MLGNLPKRKALLEIGDHGIENYFQFFVVFERLIAMKVNFVKVVRCITFGVVWNVTLYLWFCTFRRSFLVRSECTYVIHQDSAIIWVRSWASGHPLILW
jgi:hypothetical protein